MLDNAKSISEELISNYANAYAANPINKALAIAISSNDLSELAYDETALERKQFNFALNIPTMKVTNQKSSGRCWLFASLNLLREITGKRLNVEFFELSENYIAFWDKFEKINYFLESIIDTADLDIDDRTVQFILSTGVGDGGQWDMMVSLVKKYGLVPKSAMPETFASSNTRAMTSMIMMRLREFASELRKMSESETAAKVSARKEEMLAEMYTVLCRCFGTPPKTFDLEYVDKEKVYHIERGLDPKGFYDKYIGCDLDEYVCVINAPTADKPYNKSYTVKYLGNVIDGNPIKYINVDMETLKKLIVKQLEAKEIVWFGSDVGKFGNRKAGLWDIESYHYGELLGMEFGISKADSLDYRESAMNHAMLITGVSFGADGAPDKWKIENSWGDANGSAGYYMMGASWFDKYTYQAVINKKYLPDELKAVAEEAPVELNPWDPMGTLAVCD